MNNNNDPKGIYNGMPTTDADLITVNAFMNTQGARNIITDLTFTDFYENKINEMYLDQPFVATNASESTDNNFAYQVQYRPDVQKVQGDLASNVQFTLQQPKGDMFIYRLNQPYSFGFSENQQTFRLWDDWANRISKLVSMGTQQLLRVRNTLLRWRFKQTALALGNYTIVNNFNVGTPMTELSNIAYAFSLQYALDRINITNEFNNVNLGYPDALLSSAISRQGALAMTLAAKAYSGSDRAFEIMENGKLARIQGYELNQDMYLENMTATLNLKDAATNTNVIQTLDLSDVIMYLGSFGCMGFPSHAPMLTDYTNDAIYRNYVLIWNFDAFLIPWLAYTVKVYLSKPPVLADVNAAKAYLLSLDPTNSFYPSSITTALTQDQLDTQNTAKTLVVASTQNALRAAVELNKK